MQVEPAESPTTMDLLLAAFGKLSRYHSCCSNCDLQLITDTQTIIEEIMKRTVVTEGHPVPLRPSVLRFALLMEKKLQENDHKGGWSGLNILWLREKVDEELKELDSALLCGGPDDYDEEAADVANYLMMVVENRRREWVNENLRRLIGNE